MVLSEYYRTRHVFKNRSQKIKCRITTKDTEIATFLYDAMKSIYEFHVIQLHYDHDKFRFGAYARASRLSDAVELN